MTNFVFLLLIHCDHKEHKNQNLTGMLAKRASGVNFCRTFIWSISLFLKAAGSYLARTLFNLSEVVWHCLYLQGMPSSAKKWQFSE